MLLWLHGFDNESQLRHLRLENEEDRLRLTRIGKCQGNMFQELLLGLKTTLSRAKTGILSTWPRGYREEATRQYSGKRSGYASRSVEMSFACKPSTVSLPPGRHQATPSNWARFFCGTFRSPSGSRANPRIFSEPSAMARGCLQTTQGKNFQL
ncbi:hypothetical protein BJX65DRAFT_193522 [Aspergillus insuetus]